MGANPSWLATMLSGVVAVSTANTNRDGTGTIADIVTGATLGSKIEMLVMHATNDPADSVLTLFKHNGTSYFLFDEVDLNNPAAASTTASGWHYEKIFPLLQLPSSSWKLAVAITVALTAGVVNVHAEGGSA